jgi:beta-phosphoglucomutase-like phosphatase (HAD superfamily)
LVLEFTLETFFKLWKYDMARFFTLLLVQLALMVGWINRNCLWPAMGQPVVTWILSDFDQTLFNTEEARAAYYAREFASLKDDLPSGQAADVPPSHRYAAFRGWELDEAAFAELIAVRNTARLCDGALGFLLTTVASGRQIGIVSSGYQARINDLLDRDGLGGLFRFVVAVDDLEEGYVAAKPRPDLYNLGIARAQIEPERALAIEDSPSGLGGAIAAGLNSFFIPSSSRPIPSVPEGLKVTQLKSLRFARLS